MKDKGGVQTTVEWLLLAIIVIGIIFVVLALA